MNYNDENNAISAYLTQIGKYSVLSCEEEKGILEKISLKRKLDIVKETNDHMTILDINSIFTNLINNNHASVIIDILINFYKKYNEYPTFNDQFNQI